MKCLDLYLLIFVIVLKSIATNPNVSKREKHVEDFFSTLNEAYLKLNRMSAAIVWEVSLYPNKDLVKRSVELGSVKTIWRNRICSEINNLKYETLTNNEKRQLYLLCRGPKYTPYQASILSKLHDKLQTIYTESEVCVPRNVSFGSLYTETVIKDQDIERRMLEPMDSTFMDIYDDYNDIFTYPLEYDTEFSENRFNDYVCFSGEPDLERFMTGRFWKNNGENDLNVRQQETLLRWAWEAWRCAVGPPVRTIYPQFVDILNIGAQNNGYSDVGAIWREELEVDDLEKICFELLDDIMPFYKLLHAIVRAGLMRKYNIPISGLIPAHLLGNMWSQSWESLLNIVINNSFDLDESVKHNRWTILDMINRAEDFYTSMGLEKMTNEFWRYSRFEKNSNRTKCHGTAANMFQENDYRILLCADGSFEDFYTIHHEIGHIEYYMAYKNQPAILQDGTNSAFQESIGDAIMLGVMTPQHLNRLGLINDSKLFEKENNAHQIKFSRHETVNKKPNIPNISFDLLLLLRQALNKIPQIPFGFILDKYRWSLFQGDLNNSNYNKYFWDLSKYFQGIRAPTARGEEYFDIAAKFHISDNTPYIRYFLGSFLQVQLFRGLCSATVFGHPTQDELPMPLHRCDIYGSKKAGKKLREMMSLGASVQWNEALSIVTKSQNLSAAPLLEYFDPIIKWLETYVYENNIPVGW